MKVIARRVGDAPIVHSDMDERIGTNINGPSLVRLPDWVPRPLGRYYLYFADHRGAYIRLACADAVEGPWRIHPPGCLGVADSRFATTRPATHALTGEAAEYAAQGFDFFYPHVASPDVHLVPERREFRMYFHGLLPDGNQATRVALSRDGLTFDVLPDILGAPYFRVFRHGDRHYALAVFGRLYRSADGLGDFEEGPEILGPNARHAAVLLRGDMLHVFWTRFGDCPERILHGTVHLAGDWRRWRVSPPAELLRPELNWEGACEPLRPSVLGAVDGPVNELRDPFVFAENGRTWLLYAAAGERAIGLAELVL